MEPQRDVSPRQGGDDALFAVELEIARKADELARNRVVGPGLNLYCWLLAEAEILGPAGTPVSREAHLPPAAQAVPA